jgi:hypothetical protein
MKIQAAAAQNFSTHAAGKYEPVDFSCQGRRFFPGNWRLV